MTEPTSPDLSFEALLNALSDNNSGAITPEDVRSLAALSRPSVATLGAASVGGPDSTAFKNLFTTQNTLPSSLANGSSSIRYALLSQLIDVPGAATYFYNTGHAALSRATSTTKALGIVYNNPSGDGQPRAFEYEWDIVLESSDQTFWALTFFYLPDGTGWPTAGSGDGAASWTSSNKVEVHHSEPIYGDRARTVGENDKWQATSTGSKTIFLNPGDTIVPVIEYWGLPVGDAPDISTQDGMVKKFSFTTLARNVVTDAWDNDADYWTIESNRGKTQYVLGDRASIAAPTTASLYFQVCTSSTRPAPSVGQMIYETDTGNTLTYLNSFLGWKPPWNQPWGRVGTQTTPTGGAFSGLGYPLAGQTVNAWLATGFSYAFTAYPNRRYKVTVVGHAFANSDGALTSAGGLSTSGAMATSGSLTTSGSLDTLGTFGMSNGSISGGGFYAPIAGQTLSVTNPISVTSNGSSFAGNHSISGSHSINGTFSATSSGDFNVQTYGTGTTSVYDTQVARVGLLDGSNLLAATEVVTTGGIGVSWAMGAIWNSTSQADKTFGLSVRNVLGADAKYVLNSATADDKRNLIICVEDIGPVPGAVPPTS